MAQPMHILTLRIVQYDLHILSYILCEEYDHGEFVRVQISECLIPECEFLKSTQKLVVATTTPRRYNADCGFFLPKRILERRE